MRDGLIVKIMSGRFCKGLNYRLHYFYFDRCGSLATDPFSASSDQCPLCIR